MVGEKRCSVMPLSQNTRSVLPCLIGRHRRRVDESDLRGLGPWFRVRNRHDRDLGHCAGRVMRELLMFLGRGFALFAGGPAVVYQYPALRRSAAMFEARKRGGGSTE